jgi:hypothetical protein
MKCIGANYNYQLTVIFYTFSHLYLIFSVQSERVGGRRITLVT